MTGIDAKYLTPSYERLFTIGEAEEYFDGFKFKGVGWYLTPTDSMFVVPSEEFLHYRFIVWNTPSVPQYIGAIANATRQSDER